MTEEKNTKVSLDIHKKIDMAIWPWFFLIKALNIWDNKYKVFYKANINDEESSIAYYKKEWGIIKLDK